MGGSFGGGCSLRLTSISTSSAPAAAHRDASHQQRQEIDARRAFLDAHASAFAVDVGEVGTETSGDGSVDPFDAEGDLAHAFGQARDRET